MKQQTTSSTSSSSIHPEPLVTKPVQVKTTNEPKEIRYGSFLVGNGNCSIS
jgi:hypothetical protein